MKIGSVSVIHSAIIIIKPTIAGMIKVLPLCVSMNYEAAKISIYIIISKMAKNGEII